MSLLSLSEQGSDIRIECQGRSHASERRYSDVLMSKSRARTKVSASLIPE